MLLEKLGNDFIFILNLFFQMLDFPLLRIPLSDGRSFSLQGKGPVFEELLLPTVKQIDINLIFLTQIRDRHPLDEVSPDEFHFLPGSK